MSVYGWFIFTKWGRFVVLFKRFKPVLHGGSNTSISSMLTVVGYQAGGGAQGLYSAVAELGLRCGIRLFVPSEVFFFVRFFRVYLPRKLKAKH